MKLLKHSLFSLLILPLTMLAISGSVSADSLNDTVSINSSDCTAVLQYPSLAATVGNSITLSVFNSAAVSPISVSGAASGQIDPNTKTSTNDPATFSLGTMTSSPITLTFTPIAANGDGVSTLPDCPTTGPTPVATTLTINPINPPVATPAPNQNTASATASSTQVATTPATTSTTKTVTTAKKVTPKASNTLSTKNDSSKSSLATVLIILLILILIGLAVVFGLYKKGKIKNLPLFPKSKTEKPKTPGRQKKK